MKLHHVGLELQQPFVEQLSMTNKKGVAMQCNAHNPLALAPMMSDLNLVFVNITPNHSSCKRAV